MRPSPPSILLFFAGLVVGCTQEISGPVTVGVLGPGLSEGSYAIVPVEFPEVESLHRLVGPGVEVLAGARLVLDQQEIASGIESGEILTIEDVRNAMVQREGKAPRAMFSPGTLETAEGKVTAWLAEDFDSLGMATAYAHVSRARRESVAAGLPPDCLARLPLYYDLTYIEKSSVTRDKLTDNAFFMSLMGSIFFLPYDEFSTLSMAMNQGIIAHEYSHGIWSCQVEDFAPFPWRAISLDGPSAARLSAWNEGVADYFAAWVTGDPDFIALSLPELSVERDTSVARLYTQAMADDAIDGEGYNPYALGAVLASALWRVREETTDPRMADRWLIAALGALPTPLDQAAFGSGSFTVGDFLGVLVAQASLEGGPFQARVCRTFGDRFALAGPIAGCP